MVNGKSLEEQIPSHGKCGFRSNMMLRIGEKRNENFIH